MDLHGKVYFSMYILNKQFVYFFIGGQIFKIFELQIVYMIVIFFSEFFVLSDLALLEYFFYVSELFLEGRVH